MRSRVPYHGFVPNDSYAGKTPGTTTSRPAIQRWQAACRQLQVANRYWMLMNWAGFTSAAPDCLGRKTVTSRSDGWMPGSSACTKGR